MSSKKPSLVILLLMMPLASISAVLFTPALPELANIMGVSDGQVQATMTLFLFGYAIGILPYGPLAKRLGRKPTIYIGIVVGMLGSVCILVAGQYHLFSLFLIGRFLSALGSSVGMKISFTMIADAFESKQATQTLSLATLAFAIAPGLAIGLGGFLTTHYGWESCFYALLIYSLFILLLSMSLPETAPYLDPGALNLKKMKEAYLHQLKNKKVMYAGLMLGCVGAIVYSFATLAPFLAMNHIGLTPEQYGLLNFIPPVGMILGSFVSHWLAVRKQKLAVVHLGGLIVMAMTISMLCFFSLGELHVWTLFLPIPVLYFGASLIFNHGSSFGMENMEDTATGSAVMNFVNVMLATLAVFIAQSISSPPPLLLPLLFLLFGSLVLFLQHRLRKMA